MDTPIELDISKLYEYFFISCMDEDRICIQCNFCAGETWFLGKDTDAPGRNWLQPALEHIGQVHTRAGLR